MVGRGPQRIWTPAPAMAGWALIALLGTRSRVVAPTVEEVVSGVSRERSVLFAGRKTVDVDVDDEGGRIDGRSCGKEENGL